MRPIMGLSGLLYGVVAMMFGGVGSHWGLVGGAFFTDVASLREALNGMRHLDFVLDCPLGFGGKRLKKVEI